MARGSTIDDTMEALEALRREIDLEAGAIASRIREGIMCGPGCSGCCVDGLSVFDVEAEAIRRRHGDLLDGGHAHAPGACALLDAQGSCRIYPDRPYVCRTQGLVLRWTEEQPGTDEWYELRDVCPVNEPGCSPIEELPEDLCWTLGPFEARLAALQAAFQGAPEGSDRQALARVALRDLFGC